MVGSMDSLDFSLEMPIAEKNAIPLDCWNNLSLSSIWVPSHLLPNRSKPSNVKVPQGIYHTLEKKDFSKYAKSFSVYSFPDFENEKGEIFISDSDDDIFGPDSASFDKIQVSDNALPAVADHVCPHSSVCSNEVRNSTEINVLNKKPEKIDNRHLNSKENLIVNGRTPPSLSVICQEEKVREISSSDEKLINKRKNLQNDSRVCSKSLSNSVNTGSWKHFAAIKENHEVETVGCEERFIQASGKIKNTDSVNSLKDILDDTSEKNLKDFAFTLKKKDDSILLSSYDKKEKHTKKNKKDKVKKKPSKFIPLDNFLDTNPEVSQDYYCDKYFQSILKDNQKNNFVSTVPIGNNVEFPELVNAYQFIHSDKTIKENGVKSTLNSLRCDFNKPKEINENIVDVEDINPCMSETTHGKIVIENIPPYVTRDDILLILCGYGEITKFSLVPVRNSLSAYVEIDFTGDIDWIIECLNESEPFGASNEQLRCYKQ